MRKSENICPVQLTRHRHCLVLKGQRMGQQLARIRVQRYYEGDPGEVQCQSQRKTWRRGALFSTPNVRVG